MPDNELALSADAFALEQPQDSDIVKSFLAAPEDATTPEYFVKQVSEVGSIGGGKRDPGLLQPSEYQQKSGMQNWHQNQMTPKQNEVIQTLDPDDYSGDIKAGVEKAQAGETIEAGSAADAGAGSTVGSTVAKVGVQVGSKVIDELSATMQQQALEQYQREMASFVAQGKYWFDPAYESTPELDEYLNSLPSATDALMDGVFTQGIMTSDGNFDAGDLAKIFDPVGQGIEAMLGPEYDGMAEYVFQKTGERGLEGYASTGSPFGLLFGLVGVVEGIMTWNSALEEDQANRDAARMAYYKQMREYNQARSKYKALSANEYAMRKSQVMREQEAAEAAEEAKEFGTLNQRRNAMVAFIESNRANNSELLRPAFSAPGR